MTTNYTDFKIGDILYVKHVRGDGYSSNMKVENVMFDAIAVRDKEGDRFLVPRKNCSFTPPVIEPVTSKPETSNELPRIFKKIWKNEVIFHLIRMHNWVENGCPESLFCWNKYNKNMPICKTITRNLETPVKTHKVMKFLSKLYRLCDPSFKGVIPFNDSVDEQITETKNKECYKNPKRIAFLKWVKNTYWKPKVYKKEYKNQVIKELKNLYDWVDDGCSEENAHNYKPYNGLCSYIRNKFSITGEAETFLRNLFKKYDPDCDTQYPFNYGNAEFWKSEVESDSLYNNEKRIAFLKWISENY